MHPNVVKFEVMVLPVFTVHWVRRSLLVISSPRLLWKMLRRMEPTAGRATALSYDGTGGRWFWVAGTGHVRGVEGSARSFLSCKCQQSGELFVVFVNKFFNELKRQYFTYSIGLLP